MVHHDKDLPSLCPALDALTLRGLRPSLAGSSTLEAESCSLALRSIGFSSRCSPPHLAVTQFRLSYLLFSWVRNAGSPTRQGCAARWRTSADLQSAPEHRQSIGKERGRGCRSGLQVRAPFSDTGWAPGPQHKTRPPTGGRTGLGSGLRKEAGRLAGVSSRGRWRFRSKDWGCGSRWHRRAR